MQRLVGVILLLAALTLPSLADDKPAKPESDPVVFGMGDQNAVGCVIFKESTQKKVTSLEVLETQNYDIQQKKWLEDSDHSSALLNLAVKDRVKFVKIPEKYTPAQLEKARAICKEPSSAPASEKP